MEVVNLNPKPLLVISFVPLYMFLSWFNMVVNYRQQWGTELSLDTLVHLLQESYVNNWQGALCRWLFSDDYDNNMVLSYEHMFSPLDWWKEFIDKLIVPYLASWLQTVVVISPHLEYDVFHRLITR
jgi:hypothetical protein